MVVSAFGFMAFIAGLVGGFGYLPAILEPAGAIIQKLAGV
jgi:hypothetical protein